MIPFIDLRAQYHSIKGEVDAAVTDVFEQAHFALGPAVAAFEARFASYVGSPRAIGVNSGTSALHLALLALGIGPGDEVVTTPMTFVATAAAIDYTGARPVFVDVEPDTMLIDATAIESTITPRTKAILPVHLHGLPVDMDPVLSVAAAHGLAVVEDAAQSHGAEYHGRRVGSIGQLGCFSFYPGKNLGAYGEAGAVVTADPIAARTVAMLRDWGSEQRYRHELKGFNYRMDGVQGAVLGVKLGHIESWTERRRALAARYDASLGALGYRVPVEPVGRRHVYHVYAIRSSRRDALQAFLHGRGVATGIHYPVPVHLQPAFAELGHTRGDFPVAERVADEVLSLPLYPEMSQDQQDVVIEALRDWAGEEGAG